MRLVQCMQAVSMGRRNRATRFESHYTSKHHSCLLHVQGYIPFAESAEICEQGFDASEGQ